MFKISSMVSLLILGVLVGVGFYQIATSESIVAEVDAHSYQLASIGQECPDVPTLLHAASVARADSIDIGDSGQDAKYCYQVEECIYVKEWWDGFPIYIPYCKLKTVCV